LACRAALEAVTAEVNAHGEAAGQAAKSVDEVAMGFVRVANETMCRPIRALTQMKVVDGERRCLDAQLMHEVHATSRLLVWP
jgi:5-oxoprolinase (ATP-hydrolysing)